ncbi:MAG: fibronectin type III domain-containing protein [Oscillospiraceae bacterium]|nr:fibronectin type III domain-containing protein [Oscillospiraceae bacterium]
MKRTYGIVILILIMVLSGTYVVGSPFNYVSAATEKLSAPTNVKVVSQTDRVTISWDGVPGAAGYRLWIYDPIAQVWGKANKVGLDGSNSITVKDLFPDTTYFFRIAAVDKTGIIGDKKQFKVKTLSRYVIRKALEGKINKTLCSLMVEPEKYANKEFIDYGKYDITKRYINNVDKFEDCDLVTVTYYFTEENKEIFFKIQDDIWLKAKKYEKKSSELHFSSYSCYWGFELDDEKYDGPIGNRRFTLRGEAYQEGMEKGDPNNNWGGLWGSPSMYYYILTMTYYK